MNYQNIGLIFMLFWKVLFNFSILLDFKAD